MKLSLPALALGRPITVMMLIVTFLGLGVIASYRIPVEFIPKIDMPFVGCYIPYPGATPEQVEREVAIPAEGEFRTISRLKHITTTSDGNGCNVRMTFDWDASMTEATAEVRDRIERLKLTLPKEIDRIALRRFSSNSMPIMAFALFREGDDVELAHLARTLVEPRLLRLEGVADVAIFGKPDDEILIEFDQNALRSRNLGIYQVVSALQTASVNVAAGELSEGTTTFYVRTVGEFSGPEDIGNLVIGPNSLRLREVATVGYKMRDMDEEFSIDHKGGVFVLVRKESEANTVSVCKSIMSEVRRLNAEPAFAGCELFIFLDQGDLIVTSLEELRSAGKYGAALAIIVLFLFLRRLRPTLLVAMAIPASLLASMVFMFFAGMTLNAITMISMIIAMGRVVDDSIVVIDNILRHRRLGLGPVESALRGASEVGMAITASTLTTVVVFVPLLYMQGGEMATFMGQFATPATVSLAASLLVAMTVIPLFSSRMKERKDLMFFRVFRRVFPSQDAVERPGLTARAWRLLDVHPIDGIMRYYSHILSWAIRFRLATTCCVIALITVSILVPFSRVEMQRMPTVDTRQVQIAVIFEQNFDMAMARETMYRLQDAIDAQREELGIKNLFLNFNPTQGSLTIYLLKAEDIVPGQHFPYSTPEVLDILSERLAKYLPGAEVQMQIAEAGESQTRNISLLLKGDDTQLAGEYADRFRELMAAIPDITNVKADTERARSEVQLRIDQDLARQVGVTPYVIARTVDFALRGNQLPYVRKAGREIPVWAQFQEEDRKSRANLENVAVFGQMGELIPLNRLVGLSKARAAPGITRVDGKAVVTITAQTTGDRLSKTRGDINALIANYEMPRGYTITPGDELAELATTAGNTSMALIMAIMLIYLVMAALFESCVLPLSILTSVPLAFIGVYWCLFLTGTSLDAVAFIGFILLVGIIVNNGIILIDHINQLRRVIGDRHDAIVQAGQDRFRPVMMTALTTILGCIPLILGRSMGGQISFASLGYVLVGGLSVGTVLTLFVVPLFYTLIDDLREWFLNYCAALGRLGKVQAVAPE